MSNFSGFGYKQWLDRITSVESRSEGISMLGRGGVVAHSPSARSRPEHGAVAVEFALVLVPLVMLLMGTVTAGLSYTHAIGLTNAVREGSRFAATTAYPPASGNWANDVIARTRALQFDDPGVTTKICVDLYKQGTGLRVSQCSAGVPSTLPTPAAFTAPSGTPTGSCAVRVWAARTYTIDAVFVQFSNQTMTRQSVALYERSPCG